MRLASFICNFPRGEWPVPSRLGLSGLVLLVVALAFAGCDSNSSGQAPPTGTLEVAVSTAGDSPDSDGYTVAVDGSSTKQVESNGSATFREVAMGSHEVELSGIKANCVVEGSNPRAVAVLEGDTTTVTFNVSCQSTSGAVDVSVATAGKTPDPDGYVVTIDGTDSTRVGANGFLTVRGLSAGNHQVALSDLQVNCSVGQANPQSVTVTAGQTSTASFNLTCPLAAFDRIAFTSRSDRSKEDIYTIDPNGSDEKRLTTNSAQDADPSWSPDGTRLAFYSRRDGNREIYTMKPDGSGLQRVTNHSSDDVTPSWSPDGSRIAFASDRDGDFEIYTVKPDGSDLRQVTSNSAVDVAPAWSPDGTRLAFWSTRDGNREIYTIGSGGSGLQRITNNSAIDQSPDWSPGGDRIAFFSYRDGDADIYTVDSGGGTPLQIVNNSASDRRPVWAPDGNRIVFESDRGGVDDLYAVSPQAASFRQITNDADAELMVDWGPLGNE